MAAGQMRREETWTRREGAKEGGSECEAGKRDERARGQWTDSA